MKNKLTDTQIAAVLAALTTAIEQGPWDSSNFLRAIGKNLCEVRDNLTKQFNGDSTVIIDNNVNNRLVQQTNQQEVFISLYSSDGNNLQSWERIIANLPRQIISRPIYAEEENVNYLIKSKENKLNEAYVAILIDPNDVLSLSPDRMLKDKFGKPIITLKDRALNLDKINTFVHASGDYNYVKGRLIKKSIQQI